MSVQAVGNTGRVFLPVAPDYSHISMAWKPFRNSLEGLLVPAPAGAFRVALQLDVTAVSVVRESGSVIRRWPLEGMTLTQLETEMRQVFTYQGLNGAAFSVRSINPIDANVLGADEQFAFTGQRDAVAELARYFELSSQVLCDFSSANALNVTPRVWPHHFDYSLLMHLEGGAGDSGGSVSLGMSPGDKYYDQPYFYATPWPYPDCELLPEGPVPAHWHRSEWTGLVLMATDLLNQTSQKRVLAVFWKHAYRILKNLVN
ncbi:MAG: hypothetical protein KGL13_06705 [Gammaproteobacteria bacterium]|nr:hypothetical protein [Gammaproteobacteria bacterium]MDE2346140.1 hypothetical protein [Gammaproteobacteria bacterium]